MIFSTEKSLNLTWQGLPSWIRMLIGILGASFTLGIFWQIVLSPLGWPKLSSVVYYLWNSLSSDDVFKSFIMTGFRAFVSMLIGFSMALLLAILTGRTVAGWCAFFFLLLTLQKIPAIAMVHVFVQSRLGIGFLMTMSLASTVVMTFTWLVLHHRARTLDPKEVFALKVIGFRGWRLGLYGLLPHMGSAIGAAARLAMSISIVMVVLGEWQGVWADSNQTMWQYGLGVLISRNYDAIDHTARVLAYCVWLGLLGAVMDGIVNAILVLSRQVTGVDLKR